MSNDNLNQVRSFRKENVVFILSSRTLYLTMHESSITWQSRDYESSLFIESVCTCSHPLNGSSTSHTLCIVKFYVYFSSKQTQWICKQSLVERLSSSSSTTLLYIIFKSYCGIILKNPIKNLFPYFSIHFTMGSDVEVTF